MRLKVPIEEAKKGDRIQGKEVVEVLHRVTGYVRLVLCGGQVVDGFRKRDFVEVER
ncbi:MAG: hypothetical protein IMW94_10385 [Thermoanaerobacter sp.]|nr:hypothetical protein [Thermoanaerobacter sp.]